MSYSSGNIKHRPAPPKKPGTAKKRTAPKRVVAKPRATAARAPAKPRNPTRQRAPAAPRRPQAQTARTVRRTYAVPARRPTPQTRRPPEGAVRVGRKVSGPTPIRYAAKTYREPRVRGG